VRLAASTAVLLLVPAAVRAATIHVPADEPTIQAGITAARDGDEIVLADGTYRGPGNYDIDFSGKAITVRSATGDPEACVIDCGDSSGPVYRRSGFRFRSGEGSDSVLEAVTVTRGWSESGGAVSAFESSPTIRGCNFRNNTTALHFSSSSAVVEDCLIVENLAGAFSRGGIVAYTSNIVLRRCTISYNEVGAGIAIYASPFTTSHALVESCIISHNWHGVGIYHDERSTVLISCTDIFGNEGGDWVGSIADQVDRRGNLESDPLFCDAPSGDYGIDGNSLCTPWASGCRWIGARPVSCGSRRVISATLSSGAPNPFSKNTTLEFSLSARHAVRVTVHDVVGRLVSTILDEDLPNGDHATTWDARDHHGRRVAPGTYFVRLRVDGETATRKVVFLGD
jgi:hypothetical protein